jgi:hypothetical protein
VSVMATTPRPTSFGEAQRCLQCARKGHVCYAARFENGEPICMYCLDGEPCFYEQRKKNLSPEASVQTQTSSPKVNGHATAAATTPPTQKRCAGFERECGKPIGPRAALCSTCYARKNYAEKLSGASRTATTAKKAAPERTTKPRAAKAAPVEVAPPRCRPRHARSHRSPTQSISGEAAARRQAADRQPLSANSGMTDGN